MSDFLQLAAKLSSVIYDEVNGDEDETDHAGGAGQDETHNEPGAPMSSVVGEESPFHSREDDEEVSIQFDNSGNVVALTDQITDYTMRQPELHPVCLGFCGRRRKKKYTARM